MTEWGMVVALGVLIGLGVSIVTPLIKLNTAITKLTVAVERLQADTTEQQERNSRSHERIFDRLDAADREILSHDNRIKHLEEKG